MSIHLPRAFKQEPEEDKKQRIKGMKKELAEYLDDEGHLIVYRGSFERPFGREEDASRVIEKGILPSVWTEKLRKIMLYAGSLKLQRFMK